MGALRQCGYCIVNKRVTKPISKPLSNEKVLDYQGKLLWSWIDEGVKCFKSDLVTTTGYNMHLISFYNYSSINNPQQGAGFVNSFVCTCLCVEK